MVMVGRIESVMADGRLVAIYVCVLGCVFYGALFCLGRFHSTTEKNNALIILDRPILTKQGNLLNKLHKKPQHERYYRINPYSCRDTTAWI